MATANIDVDADLLLRRIQIHQRLSPTVVLHYDHASRDLRAWFWPVNKTGSRVPPSDLLDYRTHHDFRAPYCLCTDNPGCGYTETAIYVALEGPNANEYIAGCATDTCGYLINLERLYALRGLLVRRYPVRSSGTRAPVPVSYTPTPTETSNSVPSVSSLSGGSDGNGGGSSDTNITNNEPTSGSSDGLFASIATYARPIRRPETVLDRLLRLDSHARPGLTEREFNRLFAKCNCGLITTRRVFADHSCAAAMPQLIVGSLPTVIDLTSDDSDSDLSSRAASPIIIDLTID